MRYEYQTIEWPPGPPISMARSYVGLETTLNDAGQEGWDIVTVIPADSSAASDSQLLIILRKVHT